ncbi:unnamed protein product, partial [Musa acuminata subsp. burmannicoides]
MARRASSSWSESSLMRRLQARASVTASASSSPSCAHRLSSASSATRSRALVRSNSARTSSSLARRSLTSRSSSAFRRLSSSTSDAGAAFPRPRPCLPAPSVCTAIAGAIPPGSLACDDTRRWDEKLGTPIWPSIKMRTD